ncbi:MAG: protein translocase SEC61 complex subunit gamma [Candidatus Woesearchaeota archaeon]|nr:MAG: protein translocase SEC61 complex subunit gamma [Candidatus Woesearchaeota archaeon]
MKLPRFKSKKQDKEKLSSRAKRKIKEYIRVLKVTKKPDMEEFKSTVKVTGLGIVIIGVIGFIIAIIAQLIK